MYIATGTIQNTSGELISQALNEKGIAVRGRTRLSGYEIYLDNGEELEILLESHDDTDFNIDISSQSLSNLLHVLKELKELLLEMRLSFFIVYREEDEDGEQIGQDYLYFDTDANSAS